MSNSPAPMCHVSYSHHFVSGVCRHFKFFTFQSTPLKLLNHLKPKFDGIVLGWSPFRIVTDVPVLPFTVAETSAIHITASKDTNEPFLF